MQTQAERIANKLYAANGDRDVDQNALNQDAIREMERSYPKFSFYLRVRKETRLHQGTVSNFMLSFDLSSINWTANIHYLEMIVTESASAHALMSKLRKPTTSENLKIHLPEQFSRSDPIFKITRSQIKLPRQTFCADQRIPICGSRRSFFHHIAMIDAASSCIVYTDEKDLWNRFRSGIEVPTLESWYDRILPQVIQKKIINPCYTYSIASKKVAWVDESRKSLIDEIVCDHVKRFGF